MANQTSGTDDDTARMTLEADAFHEAEELSIDCPQCGATVSVMQIAETGRCDGTVEAKEIEGDSETPTGNACNASLSLELLGCLIGSPGYRREEDGEHCFLGFPQVLVEGRRRDIEGLGDFLA